MSVTRDMKAPGWLSRHDATHSEREALRRARRRAVACEICGRQLEPVDVDEHAVVARCQRCGVEREVKRGSQEYRIVRERK